MWDAVAGLLAVDHRVLRVDLPGHGQSEKRPASCAVEDNARAVAVVLDHLQIARTHVAAHSAGGDVLVAMLTADASRVASGTFLGTAPDLSFVRMGFAAKVMRLPIIGRVLWALAGENAIRDGLRATFAPGTTSIPDEYVTLLRMMTYDAYANGIAELETFKNRLDLCSRVAGVGVPLLVVFGDADQWVSPRAAARWGERTDARVEYLDGVGHTPMAEAPAPTAALIREMVHGSASRGGTGHR